MRLKRKKILSSTLPITDTNTQPNPVSETLRPGSLLNVLHQSCYTLPLSCFIKCLCEEDLTALIISGTFSEQQLQAKWFDIYSEFIELSDTPDSKILLRIIREIILSKTRILKVQMIVRYLVVQWDEELISELRLMNFRYKYDPNNPLQYSKDLKLVLSRIKNWEIDLKLKEAEYDAYQKKSTGEKPERIYFLQSIVRMSQFYKYRINPEEVTTVEFCLMKKEYIEYCENINKENAKRR